MEARRDPRREGRGPLRCGGDGPGGWGHGVSGSGRLRVLRSQAPTGGPGGAVRERVTRWGERAENGRARWARGEAGWASGANWAEGVWAARGLGFGFRVGLGFLFFPFYFYFSHFLI